MKISVGEPFSVNCGNENETRKILTLCVESLLLCLLSLCTVTEFALLVLAFFQQIPFVQDDYSAFAEPNTSAVFRIQKAYQSLELVILNSQGQNFLQIL